MTEKEKQIEEMAKQMCGAINNSCIHDCTPACGAREYAKRCIEAGYRKQSEVAENIIAMLRAAKPVVKTHFEAYDELIENIAAEYGAEVEK